MSAEPRPALWDKMRSHPRAAEMIAEADALQAATEGFYAEDQTVDARKFLGCWARARRKWCDFTGEPLV